MASPSRLLLFALLHLAAWSSFVSAALKSCTTVKGEEFPSLIDATLEDLSRGLESNLFTSVDLVNAYVARIREVNDTFRVVTELNPDALSIAAELDGQRANGTIRGPLHGIPILIKNNIATADKMNNTAGSYALLGATVPHDSFMARKLREAGAVILGKANLSQWANFRSSNSSSGWSAHGGQCLGAYHPNQNPSGSSSGSGVAAALGLALATLGTETDGSIVSPSMRNSLVGIKPTVGLTSRDLVIPISEHQDTIGPMARTVKDAAYLLQAIAGFDPNDNYTSAIPGGGASAKIPDYVAACGSFRLLGARIGVPSNVLALYDELEGLNASSSVEIAAYYEALGVLASAGAEVVEGADFTAARETFESDAEITVLRADFISNLASYLARLETNPQGVAGLGDVRAFTRASPLEAFPDRNTAIWDAALDVQGFNNSDPRFWEAYERDLFLGGEGGLLGAIERHDLDAVVMPTWLASGWAAIVGAPIVTVPLGYYDATTPVTNGARGLVETGPNVPFGLSFLGAHWTEEKLIALAFAFEQRTMARDKVPPYILPRMEIGHFAGF